MSDDDRRRWDERYAAPGGTATGPDGEPPEPPEPPELAGFTPAAATVVAGAGRALDLACGTGRAALWLAWRGLEVVAVDISTVGLARLDAAARALALTDRLRTVAADLDDGLDGRLGSFDVVVCLRFRGDVLDQVIERQLAPGGLLVTSRLSVVGRTDAAGSGPDPRFLAAEGELAALAARHALVVQRHHEGHGEALLVATRPGPSDAT